MSASCRVSRFVSYLFFFSFFFFCTHTKKDWRSQSGHLLFCFFLLPLLKRLLSLCVLYVVTLKQQQQEFQRSRRDRYMKRACRNKRKRREKRRNFETFFTTVEANQRVKPWKNIYISTRWLRSDVLTNQKKSRWEPPFNLDFNYHKMEHKFLVFSCSCVSWGDHLQTPSSTSSSTPPLISFFICGRHIAILAHLLSLSLKTVRKLLLLLGRKGSFLTPYLPFSPVRASDNSLANWVRGFRTKKLK